MDYYQPANPQMVLATIERLCRHHDHLKALVREYALMRQEQTYGRMVDPTFQTDPSAMAAVDSRKWLRTSLIVDVSKPEMGPLFSEVDDLYANVSGLIQQYYPTCEIDVYFDSAHITVKSIATDVPQTTTDVEKYAAIIRPIVRHWLESMGADTRLYAQGLFTSLSVERGLSMGLQFLPSLPLLQIIRGEVGVALYERGYPLALRPEASFHTTLTHLTGLRARLCHFPLNPTFIHDFRKLIESYDHHLFGVISSLTPADFVIRHGYSDQLVPLVEVSCTTC